MTTVDYIFWGFMLLLVLLTIVIYSFRESRRLRRLGYDFVCDYLKSCGKVGYYRNAGEHIAALYKANYDELNRKRSRWYLFFGTERIIGRLIAFYEKADSFTESIAPYFSLQHYFAYSEYLKFVESAEMIEEMIPELANKELLGYVAKREKDSTLDDQKMETYRHRLAELRDMHNARFVEKELADNKVYFDTLLEYPLDPQQRRSIVKLEDNCLVISSAGSGKTSTSIAKVKYLLAKRKTPKEEILVMSFNRKTAEEFQERLNVSGLKCRTFHGFACDIIAKVEKKFPDICEDTLLLTCFYDLVERNAEFKKAVNTFVAEKSSLTKLEFEYEEAEDYYNDRSLYGIMAPYGDMNGRAVFTRSEEEKRICTWLSSHDIDFLYEQPYPINTADTQRRQYKPDFTIYNERARAAYFVFLEHFGIDSDGNVPFWFGDGCVGGYNEANNEYNDGINWKRDIHRSNHTVLLETTSAMFHDHSIFDNLEAQLRRQGFVPRELTEDEKYERLIRRNRAMEENVMNLFSSFIALMKSNGQTFDSIMKTIEDSGKPKDFCERNRFLMYDIIKPLYEEYESTLRRRNQRDFIDIILCATEYCNTGRYRPNLSYILIDEFQDISVDRYKFLLSLRKSAPLTKTFCVGDDWQSIYRFNGSDINLFKHFEKYFGFTEKCRIETTYRFGNPLVRRSSAFILKNPTQEKKEVKPINEEKQTKLSFVAFSRRIQSSYLQTIREVLDSIPADESVMLLARYNNEVRVFPDLCVRQNPNSKRATVNYAGRTMSFMSVHAAKGLEADHVLLLNCSQDAGGFPSRVADDPILGYVLSEVDEYPYSEERRLFYVAITRAKKHTYVFYNENMPSEFVTEMLDDEEDMEKSNHQMVCPVCKRGRFKAVRQGMTRNGRMYKFFLCSNSIAGCRNKWMVFYDYESEVLPKYHHMVEMAEQAKKNDRECRARQRRSKKKP